MLTLENERHIPVHTDRLLLSQAVYNLLSNTCKFTLRGGRVTVSVTITYGRAAIRVCNNGPGIPEPDLNRIFEAYQRGTALQDTPGEGLGLYIARRNIETAGSTILAQNQKEGGVCFIIDIPVE